MSIQEKIKKYSLLFASLPSLEMRYEKLIELGKSLPDLPPEKKCDVNKIHACQSNTYLYTYMEEGKFRIQGSSDALISKGLVCLLLEIFDKEDPQSIVKTSSALLEEIGLEGAISPSRANGLYHAHLRIRQEALKFLLQNKQ
jgi:cysteine desulfuration protein SufE